MPGGAERDDARAGSLWLCADLSALAPDEILERAERVASAVPHCVVWLRPSSSTPARTLLALTRSVIAAVRLSGARVMVGDRVDVAIAAGADGVHLPARGLTPGSVRSVFAKSAAETSLISVAAHDAASLVEGAAHADYLVLSPLFEVPGKEPPLGVGRFAALRAQVPGRRVIALGGIGSREHAGQAARAGADGIAVRRAFLFARDPAGECRALYDAFHRRGVDASRREP